MRHVLHDFYVPVCKELVKNIAGAMGPSSRFIIADMIMPEKVQIGTEATPYWMDFNRKLRPRMAYLLTESLTSEVMLLNGTEKSKKQFEEILDTAGLEIVKIFPFPFGCYANIECRLKTGAVA